MRLSRARGVLAAATAGKGRSYGQAIHTRNQAKALATAAKQKVQKRRQPFMYVRPWRSFKLSFRIRKPQPRPRGPSHSSSTRQSSSQERSPARKPAMAKPSERRVHHPSKPSCGVKRMVERPAAGTPKEKPTSAAIPIALAVRAITRAAGTRASARAGSGLIVTSRRLATILHLMPHPTRRREGWQGKKLSSALGDREPDDGVSHRSSLLLF
jgi:hypothetical protein